MFAFDDRSMFYSKFGSRDSDFVDNNYWSPVGHGLCNIIYNIYIYIYNIYIYIYTNIIYI